MSCVSSDVYVVCGDVGMFRPILPTSSLRRRSDGKLEIDKSAAKPKINPYLYGDRSKVDQFTESPNFRPLRYDGNKGHHIHLARDLEVQRIRSRKVEKADFRKRVSLLGTVQWATSDGGASKALHNIAMNTTA